MNRLVLTAGLTCALALPAIAGAQTPPPSNPSSTPSKSPADHAHAAANALAPTDKAFVLEAAHGGVAEVELGRLAAEKASNPEVKQFGQRMVDDHSKASDELKGLASQKNVTLPTEPDANEKALQARLSKLSGDAFDKAYIEAMVADHNKDVAAFTRASKSAKDADLKEWAGKTLPTLQEHQKLAKELSAKVRGTATPVKKSGVQ
jgi:putative membrane protein